MTRSTAQILIERDEILTKIKGKTIGDLLLQNARLNGDKPAVSWKEGATWRTEDWRQMRERVLDVGCGLASLGLGRGDFVGVMAANRPEHVIGVMGVVHAAASPSTFYSTLTAEQIHYVADNCGAKAAILENSGYMERWVQILDRLPGLELVVLMEDAEAYAGIEGVQVISWRDLVERGRAARGEHQECWREARPEDPVTVIYTSGTTGPPKGVVLTHENCLFEAEAIDRRAGLVGSLTSVSYLPLAHIAEQVLSIYLPLQKASHVYYCPEVTKAVEYVKEARPSFFFGVPRVWEKMRAGITTKMSEEASPVKRRMALAAVDAGTEVAQRQERGDAIPLLLRLKHAILERLVLGKVRAALGLDSCIFATSAAAPLPVDVAEFFAGLGLPIIEAYGMTETTGVATANLPGKIRVGTVGPELLGVEVKLADDGEILVRGPNNTPGYLNLPEATADLIDEQGWLHTGDVGMLDSAGYFRVVDRKKELIITAGGKNISPANLENALKEHPLVGQALAYGDRKPYVVALIVLDGEVAPTWAKQEGIAYTDLGELTLHPRVQEEVQRAVEAANAKVARVEQVKRFEILPTEWTAESEELTPTMKLKRRVIHSKYADEIEGLYQR